MGGVFLSRVDGPERGNFTVWPGSHRLIEARLRQQGPGAFSAGFPADLGLGPPRALQAEPGDGLIAHYALAHGIGPNCGPHVRYATFYRLRHRAHAELGERPLTDIWLEWEGLRAGLQADGAALDLRR